MFAADLSRAFGFVVAHERIAQREAERLTMLELSRSDPRLYLDLIALYCYLENELWRQHGDVFVKQGLQRGVMLTGINPKAPVSRVAVAAHQMLVATQSGRVLVAERLARAWSSLRQDVDRLQLALALVAFCSALLKTERALKNNSLDTQLRSWGAALAAA